MSDKTEKRGASTTRPRKALATSPRDAVISLARLFELASRTVHSAGYANGLYPAQWTTLRYLADAPELSRTSAHLARFQQIAIGPVTRTVRTLIAKELVTKTGQGAHHRSKLLALTPKGQKMLESDPLQGVTAILRALPGDDQRKLAEVFVRIIASLQSPEKSDAHIELSP